MTEVKEILRLWLDGRSLRDVSKLAGPDRKTVRYAAVRILGWVKPGDRPGSGRHNERRGGA